MTTYGIGEFRMRNGGKAVGVRAIGNLLYGVVDGEDHAWNLDGTWPGMREFDLVAPWVEPVDPEDKLKPFQGRVFDWLIACFGEEISQDKIERNHRFLEEALELVQSTGCTREEAYQLVDYVFDRPVGEPRQEVGGVEVTLAALCSAHNIDKDAAAELELSRIWTKVENIRAKQQAKPKSGPLPGPSIPEAPDPIDTEMQAWLAKVEDGLEGVTPGKWIVTFEDSYCDTQICADSNKRKRIANVHPQKHDEDANHIANTNPKRMAELIGWLKSKGVMK